MNIFLDKKSKYFTNGGYIKDLYISICNFLSTLSKEKIVSFKVEMNVTKKINKYNFAIVVFVSQEKTPIEMRLIFFKFINIIFSLSPYFNTFI